MSVWNFIITLLLLAYLLGSIPFGLIVVRIVKKMDIREYGSGNIGVTNVTRLMGKKWGGLVLLLDGLKGAIPVLLAKFLFPFSDLVPVMVAIVAVLGHVFPIYLKFKGGKGVATTIAVLFALNWILGLCLILTWYAVFLISRISAISSLVAMMVTTLLSTFIASFEVMIMCTILTIIIVVRHRSNIKLLLAGKERKFKK